MRKQHNKGFTLLELLVVMAILGILSAVALPRFNASRANADAAADEANISTITSELQIYLLDKGGDYNSATLANDGTVAGTGVAVGNLVTDGYLNEMPKHPGQASTGTHTYTKDENEEVVQE